MSDWLKTVRRRLAAHGFHLIDDLPFGPNTFKLFARLSRFELLKFGYSESFFVFAEFDRLTPGALRSFSADAYECAKKHKACPLPCGLFESVWVYAVALAESADEATLRSVREDMPPKHWASAEIPVVYHAGNGRLHYFEKTPIWGSAYYAGFRKQIRRHLIGEG